MYRPAAALTALVALGTFLACSPAEKPTASPGSAPPTAIPTPLVLPTPTSSVTVDSTAAPWSKREAVAAYSTIMEGTQDALSVLAGQASDSGVESARRAITGVVDASRRAGSELAEGRWPAAVRPEINTLIAALLTQADFFASVAARPTIEAMRTDNDRFGQTLLVTRSATAAAATALGAPER